LGNECAGAEQQDREEASEEHGRVSHANMAAS
jgi:hypothetical protein